MPPLGFAIVGCGMISRFHVRALQEVPGARVAARSTSRPGLELATQSRSGLVGKQPEPVMLPTG